MRSSSIPDLPTPRLVRDGTLPLGRIPVARAMPGPSGLDWMIEAVWADEAGTRLPAFLLRPCLRYSFVGDALADLAAGRLSPGLDRLLLRPGQPKLLDPLPFDDVASEPDDPSPEQVTIDLRDPLAFGAPAAVVEKPSPEGSSIDPQDPGSVEGDRRALVDTHPWSLLEDPLEILGMPELAGVESVAAALIALQEVRVSERTGGRTSRPSLPAIDAALVEALIRCRLPPREAAERARSSEISPPARARGRGTRDPLTVAADTLAKAVRNAQGPALVPDREAAPTRSLVQWLRRPRTACLLRVVAGGGPVTHLHVGLGHRPTINGWMEAVDLDFHAAEVTLAAHRDPPVWLSPEDIDRAAGVMRVRGFAASQADLVARFRG